MSGHKIMVVEDERIVAADIRACVEKMGYSVCAAAASGSEAVEKAGRFRPDLILMDISLKGGIDGIAAAGQIRELYRIPVVYLTAFGEEDMVHRAKVAEPYGYVTKPFEARELRIAIEIALYKKQAESRIAQVEHWLATVLRSIGDAVIALDKEHRITYINTVAERLTGWSREEALGRRLTEVLNIKNQDLEGLEKYLVEKVITEGLIINLMEDRLLVAKDGTEIPISDSAAPIKDDHGETPGSVIVFRDITENKRAEEALKAHQIELETQNEELRRTRSEVEALLEQYTNLYDFAPVGYMTLGFDHRIVDANLTTATLLGEARGALSKKPLSRFILPGDRDSFDRCGKECSETGAVRGCELRMVKTDGTAIWVYLTVMAARNPQGEPVLRVAMNDVTERKRAEEKIRASLREKETMLREIYHRVKNNMQVISSLLSLQSSCLQDENAREALRNSIDRVRAMADIHNLLYHSDDMARIDIGGFIRDLTGSLRQSYHLTGDPVDVDVDTADVSLTLEQAVPCGLILNELVTNALKHAFPEGRGGRIDIAMRAQDGHVALTVRDNGAGFPGTVDAAKPKAMGMELVNILVAQIGGRIDMRLEGGTVWTITFPVRSERVWRDS